MTTPNTALPLARLVAMIQDEVQKAYDAALLLNREALAAGRAADAVHIAVERMEIEMPVEFSTAPMSREAARAVESGGAEASQVALILDRPFPDAAAGPAGKRRLPLELKVRPVGLAEGRVRAAGESALVGRIKISVAPILR